MVDTPQGSPRSDHGSSGQPDTLPDNHGQNVANIDFEIGEKKNSELTFQVDPLYDNTFLKDTTPQNKHLVVSIPDLLALDEEEISFEPSTTCTPKSSNVFLWCVLLALDPPSLDKKKDFSYMKNIRNKKAIKMTTPVKRTLKFGDLMDRGKGTFTVIEKTNQTSNNLWMRDQGKKICINQVFAILSPKVEGKLRSGSVIISTDRPIERLTAPQLPMCKLLPNLARDVITFFIAKYKVIKPVSTPVVIYTQCNADACDRLGNRNKENYSCGCYNQYSRSDTDNRNSVLKFDFAFQDDQGQPETQRVEHFTSLRTTKLFFEKQLVSISTKNVAECPALQQLVFSKCYKLVDHINTHGGWTIVGWYMRASKDVDEDDDNDVHALYHNVRINVSYLYPSTCKHGDIPTECVITKKEVVDTETNR